MEYVLIGDTPTTRCVYYRQVHGLPAYIDPPMSQRIAFRAGTTGAITMPAALGDAVRTRLCSRRSELGPIIWHPLSNRWTYLVRPDVPDDDTALFCDLFAWNVSVVRIGVIALPSTAAAPGSIRRWIHLPRNDFKPSCRVVVDAVRACAGHITRREPMAVPCV
ncbi:DNA-directed RNA polymerase subunit beta [Nocardia brasiliensis]|uniref:DNA-directed RNA polymerase subunit beta n=1 Tax=Nocardia brasiliensis TaxID=37326 RepID=UPI002454726B|nr:DNA-directed RNA polymerase subunit beta [Nocardia brasiliensis]